MGAEREVFAISTFPMQGREVGIRVEGNLLALRDIDSMIKQLEFFRGLLRDTPDSRLLRVKD